jgi:hypothetical protein
MNLLETIMKIGFWTLTIYVMIHFGMELAKIVVHLGTLCFTTLNGFLALIFVLIVLYPKYNKYFKKKA